MTTTVLITGTSGFLGSHLVRALRDKYETIQLNRRPLPTAGRHVIWSFCEQLPPSLPKSVDAVIHAAATDGRDPDHADCDCLEVNVRATERLLNYACEAGARKFLYLSTGSVFGLSANPHKESDALAPEGAYACSKAGAEVLVSKYQSHMQTLCVRLFYPYGPGQRLPRLVPGILVRLAAGQKIPLNGPEGYPKVNPLFIADLVRWVKCLIEGEASGTYNLAGTEILSIRDLASRMALLLGTTAEFEYQRPVSGHLIGDIERVCKDTGISPAWTLDRGLAEVIRIHHQAAV